MEPRCMECAVDRTTRTCFGCGETISSAENNHFKPMPEYEHKYMLDENQNWVPILIPVPPMPDINKLLLQVIGSEIDLNKITITMASQQAAKDFFRFLFLTTSKNLFGE
jgi:hypothetical protein